MNKHFASLTLAAVLTPTAALSQTAPAPLPPPGAMGAPTAAQRSAMQQMRMQMVQLHERARAQMLGALTPQHRAFVQNVIGQLATAPTPNFQAAAGQIDAALSSSEKSSILSTEASMRTSARSLKAAQRAQFEGNLSPAQREQMQTRHSSERAGWQGSRTAQDPGAILLRTLSGHGGGMMHEGMHEGMRP